MGFLLLAGLIPLALFIRVAYRHHKRRVAAARLVSQIKPQYLHGVAQRTTALAVEHAAHGRHYLLQLELLVAIAERVELLSMRPMHSRFRIEAQDQFIHSIRLAEMTYGDRIRRGELTGMDAVDCPDELGEVLSRELGIRHLPRAALALPDDPLDIFYPVGQQAA